MEVQMNLHTHLCKHLQMFLHHLKSQSTHKPEYRLVDKFYICENLIALTAIFWSLSQDAFRDYVIHLQIGLHTYLRLD